MLKLRDADTTLMYRVALAALGTAVQPPPVLVIACGPDVMLKLEATPVQEPICKVPELLVYLMQSPAIAVNSTPLAAVLVKLVLLQVDPPAALLAAELDATELTATELELLETATLDEREELVVPPTKP